MDNARIYAVFGVGRLCLGLPILGSNTLFDAFIFLKSLT